MVKAVKEAKVLYNAKGRRTHVLLPYKAYQELIEHIEDLSDLAAMKEVKHEKPIPWKEAKKILAKRRR